MGLVVPDLDALETRLRNVSERLDGTRFSWRPKGAHFEVTCPWGNRFRAHAAGGAYGGPLGIPYVEMPIAKGAAAGVARFYRSVMGAPVKVEGTRVCVNAGPGQSIVFQEGEGHDAEYDGHHFAIYVADFSGPHRALAERGLVTREDNPYQYPLRRHRRAEGKEGAVHHRARGAEPVSPVVPAPAREPHGG